MSEQQNNNNHKNTEYIKVTQFLSDDEKTKLEEHEIIISENLSKFSVY